MEREGFGPKHDAIDRALASDVPGFPLALRAVANPPRSRAQEEGAEGPGRCVCALAVPPASAAFGSSGERATIKPISGRAASRIRVGGLPVSPAVADRENA